MSRRPVTGWLRVFATSGRRAKRVRDGLLVRMGRLELPRALHPLEPKSSASANSATSAQN